MTVDDLNPKKYPLDPTIHRNLTHLAVAVTVLEDMYGEEFRVTSGLRTAADQLRINPTVKQSAHMWGEAVDVADRRSVLWNWCADNAELLSELGLYMEAKVYTPRHVHLQMRKPASGNRIFIP